MQIERFYLGCLAHASYIVHDDGEAAVIDPQRDVALYIDEAAKRGLRIRWVIESHLHADFVSGHVELARRAGAVICIGAGSGATFEHRELNDGDEVPLGKGFLRVISTPGHTEEGVCIVAIDSANPTEPVGVFTGDTLFIGDVGRPDLSPTKTPQQLASLLYDSLHKLLALPHSTPVFPAHGAGSLCGRQVSTDSNSTIGKELKSNYALQPMSREQFIDLMTGDLPERPAYFQAEIERNRTGASGIEELPPLRELHPAEVDRLRAGGAIVLDTRPAIEFAAAHIPGSIHIALSGDFASWAARLLGVEDVELVLLAEDESAIEESRLRLARVGLENVAGFIADGIFGWVEAGRPVQSLNQISAQEFAEQPPVSEGEVLIDVREKSERATGAIPGSISIPLSELRSRIGELDPNASVIVHCKGGYRSSIAGSLLQSRSFANVLNMTGGYDAWLLSSPSMSHAAQ